MDIIHINMNGMVFGGGMAMRIKRCFTILFTLILIVSVSGMVVRAAEYRSPDDPEVSEIMARAEVCVR